MSNRVRIIGGEWRRRLLDFPSVPGLRPTADRVRETLFNWLGQTLETKRCLDLFAGSGALGFEAASRGAQQVMLIERDPKVVKALTDNAAKLNAGQIHVRRGDGLAWLQQDTSVYDVIFVDPPFQSGLLDQVLPLLQDRLTADGQAYVESGRPIVPPEGMQLSKQGRAGQVYFGLLAKHD